jgi:uncharacterized protein
VQRAASSNRADIFGLERRLNGDSIDYQRLVEDALRETVRRVLAQVAEQGLPGDHHFYIGFRTGHPGVVMPRSLRDLYPEEMSLILQHHFWGLAVDEDGFAVELSFSGSRQRLEIPFAALTMFADPSAEFALRFMPRVPGAVSATAATAAAAATPASAAATKPAAPAAASPVGRGIVAPQPPPSGTAGGADGASSPSTGGRPGSGEVIRFDPSRRK